MNTTTTTSLDFNFAIIVYKSGFNICKLSSDTLTLEELKALNPKAVNVIGFYNWTKVQSFAKDFWESRGMEKYTVPMEI